MGLVTYVTRVDVRHVTLENLDSLVECARQYGYPYLHANDKALNVAFVVGSRDIPDLWELRGLVAELEAEFSSYDTATNDWPKPELWANGDLATSAAEHYRGPDS